MRSQNSDSSNGGGGGGSNGGNSSNNGDSNSTRLRTHKTSDNVTFECRIKNKYYWTYGGYAHTFTECTRQENGHKTDTTLTSRMDGSNVFCK